MASRSIIAIYLEKGEEGLLVTRAEGPGQVPDDDDVAGEKLLWELAARNLPKGRAGELQSGIDGIILVADAPAARSKQASHSGRGE